MGGSKRRNRKIMKNEFCTYEQSLALKELGFDEPCLTYYHENQRLESEIVFIKGSKFWNLPNISEIAAPLYQQAFRWFREKYNLIGWIEKYPLQKVYVLELPKYNPFDDPLCFDTYEEAESACLDKLIEICKNK